jgi:hypothetical protein
MENLLDTKVDETQKLELNQESTAHFIEIRKWTNFLAILGYVVMGLIIIASIVMASTVSLIGSTPLGGVSAIPMILIAVVYFFPIYYLYKFSVISKRAIADNDSGSLSEAFKYMKFHYRFMGIMAIVVMGLYAVIIIGAVIFSSFLR